MSIWVKKSVFRPFCPVFHKKEVRKIENNGSNLTAKKFLYSEKFSYSEKLNSKKVKKTLKKAVLYYGQIYIYPKNLTTQG